MSDDTEDRTFAPDPDWRAKLDARIDAELDAISQQSERDKLSADEIIAKYYMRRGRNKKLTLRQHMKDVETTLSEGYIRKVKWAYDKRHKRGKPG